MSNKMYARHKVGQFIMNKTGISFMELPDNNTVDDWVEEDMDTDDIDSIIPDLAWEILDLSGMNRDTVDKLCYPENFEDEEE